ncbi:hypothetical protein BDZ91DRAFT_274768 [Kalaharituber pfeilii]|nr:hypothetical protein BDZ91DRAFT_274768 [Kalaharituber pfeilii]
MYLRWVLMANSSAFCFVCPSGRSYTCLGAVLVICLRSHLAARCSYAVATRCYILTPEHAPLHCPPHSLPQNVRLTAKKREATGTERALIWK